METNQKSTLFGAIATRPTITINNALLTDDVEKVKQNYSDAEYYKQTGIRLLGEQYKFSPYTHSEMIYILENNRNAHKINKSKLSNLAGYSATCYTNLLKGKRFSLKSFLRFLKVFKLDINQYLYPAYRNKYKDNLFTQEPIKNQSDDRITHEAEIQMVKDAELKFTKSTPLEYYEKNIPIDILIKLVKRAGYKVYKRIENWEEI